MVAKAKVTYCSKVFATANPTVASKQTLHLATAVRPATETTGDTPLGCRTAPWSTRLESRIECKGDRGKRCGSAYRRRLLPQKNR